MCICTHLIATHMYVCTFDRTRCLHGFVSLKRLCSPKLLLHAAYIYVCSLQAEMSVVTIQCVKSPLDLFASYCRFVESKSSGITTSLVLTRQADG